MKCSGYVTQQTQSSLGVSSPATVSLARTQHHLTSLQSPEEEFNFTSSSLQVTEKCVSDFMLTSELKVSSCAGFVNSGRMECHSDIT